MSFGHFKLTAPIIFGDRAQNLEFGEWIQFSSILPDGLSDFWNI